MDLGTAHAMRSCPANLLSLSKILDIGPVLYCSKGDCWIELPPRFQSHGDKVRLPLNRVGSLFELKLHKLALDADVDLNMDNVHSLCTAEVNAGFEAHDEWGPTDFSDPQFYSCAVKGKYFLGGSLDLWHRRMRHMSKDTLKRIRSQGPVDGFNMVGNHEVSCGCETCSMAKIRAHRNDRSSSFPVATKRIGERVSSDVKSVPFKSFEGYRYVVNFVDHHSRLGNYYFMRR